jgi:cell division protease FtsH
VINGEPLGRDDDTDQQGPSGNAPSVAAIPKTRGRREKGGDLPEPEPTA